MIIVLSRCTIPHPDGRRSRAACQCWAAVRLLSTRAPCACGGITYMEKNKQSHGVASSSNKSSSQGTHIFWHNNIDLFYAVPIAAAWVNSECARAHFFFWLLPLTEYHRSWACLLTFYRDFFCAVTARITRYCAALSIPWLLVAAGFVRISNSLVVRESRRTGEKIFVCLFSSSPSFSKNSDDLPTLD